MTEPMLNDILMFAGVMAAMGMFTKIVLTMLQRRRSPPGLETKAFDEISERLSHLEQVAEATALEVERIGEGQRFTTKLLGEKNKNA